MLSCERRFRQLPNCCQHGKGNIFMKSFERGNTHQMSTLTSTFFKLTFHLHKISILFFKLSLVSSRKEPFCFITSEKGMSLDEEKKTSEVPWHARRSGCLRLNARHAIGFPQDDQQHRNPRKISALPANPF